MVPVIWLLSNELERLCYVARYRELVSLTTEQREELKRWAQSRSVPAGDAFRARLVLALADGMTYGAIKQSLHTTAPTISRWKQCFRFRPGERNDTASNTTG